MRAPLAALAVLAWSPCLAAAEDEEVYSEPPRETRVRLTAWGGSLLDLAARAPGVAHVGGEVAYALEGADVGVLAEAYKLGDRARTPWSPVVLARYLQRFETRRGVDATVGAGLGVGRAKDWIAWYQLALGVRLSEGPFFLSGEVGFERLDLLRLAAGVGVGF